MVGVLICWWRDECGSILGSLFSLWSVKWGHQMRGGENTAMGIWR